MAKQTEFLTKHPDTGESISWWTFDTTELPAERYHYGDLAMQRLRGVLTREELERIFDELINKLNAQTAQVVEFCHALVELKNRLKHFGHEDHYIELAMVWTYCPELGEKPDKWSPEINRIKLRMLKENEDARFFFIHMAGTLIYDLSNYSVGSFHQLLAEQNQDWAETKAGLFSNPANAS
jgi:hypothetical protein